MKLPEGSVVAAPDGESGGSGTYADPIGLASALGANSPVRPGGELLLRGGVYAGSFTSELRGRRSDPIVVRSFPGEWAVLDGGRIRAATLTVRGRHTVIQDLEITRSDPQRRTETPGSHPDLSRSAGTGVDVFGVGTRLSGLVVHDNGNGIGLWGPAEDAEVVGCLIFNNGWVGPDRGHGHGIYVQNRNGTKRITDSVVFNNFGYGIHAYGENGHVDGLVVEGVTSFENGAPAGKRYPNVFAGTSKNPVDRVSVRSSVLYHRPSAFGRNLQIGFGSEPNRFAEIRDNVVVGGSPAFVAMNFEDLDVRGNVFHSERHSTERRFLIDLEPTSRAGLPPVAGPAHDYTWDGNTYIDRPETGSGPFASFLFDAESSDEALAFPQWREAAEVDASSTYSTEQPRTTDVVVRPTGSGRAIITVLNPTKQRSIELDPRDIDMPVGADFEIKDAQDFLGDAVVSGTWDAGPIEIPLDSGSVSQPVGSGGHALDRTPIEFGTFVLLRR